MRHSKVRQTVLPGCDGMVALRERAALELARAGDIVIAWPGITLLF